MKVSINQPAYLPWLGYFQRIALSDLHVVLDHVQFEKNSFTNRNRIRTKEGAIWLTVPLATKGRFGNLSIHALEFAPHRDWRRKHWKAIRLNYGHAPFFEQYGPDYEALYARDWNGFMPMARAFLARHLTDLHIDTPLVFSSEMKAGGTKGRLVAELCREVGARTYLSGTMGRNYLDEEDFRPYGIDVEYQEFRHPAYTQSYPGFLPNMAVLDLIFNHGPESADILRSTTVEHA